MKDEKKSKPKTGIMNEGNPISLQTVDKNDACKEAKGGMEEKKESPGIINRS